MVGFVILCEEVLSEFLAITISTLELCSVLDFPGLWLSLDGTQRDEEHPGIQRDCQVFVIIWDGAWMMPDYIWKQDFISSRIHFELWNIRYHWPLLWPQWDPATIEKHLRTILRAYVQLHMSSGRQDHHLKFAAFTSICCHYMSKMKWWFKVTS